MAVPQARAAADEERRAVAATYYGMLSEVDEQFGRLIDGVDALRRSR